VRLSRCAQSESGWGPGSPVCLDTVLLPPGPKSFVYVVVVVSYTESKETKETSATAAIIAANVINARSITPCKNGTIRDRSVGFNGFELFRGNYRAGSSSYTTRSRSHCCITLVCVRGQLRRENYGCTLITCPQND